MLIIPVKDGENIDRALKRLKQKVDRTKLIKMLRGRKQFKKPSVKNREKMIKAEYLEKKKIREEES